MASPNNPRPYTIRDQVALRRLGHFAVSPDGSRVVLTVATAARSNGRLDSHLWSVNADGTGLRRLTRTPGSHSSPAFSPDGRSLFYLSGRPSAKRQIVRLTFDSGRTEPITDSPIDIDSFVLSRDGSRVAFSVAVYPGRGDTLAATAARIEADKGRAETGQIHDRLFIRHWDEWKTGRRRHVFVQAVAGGQPVDVMPAMDADAPTKPFGGREQYTFTPDGNGVVFTAVDVGREEAWSTDLDLFLAPIDGRTAPRKLTTENRATDTDPAFSPDGTLLAYLAMDRPGYEADKRTVLIRDWQSGATRRLTDGWDRSADAIEWSADGQTIYVTADDVGQHGLFAVDVATGSVATVVGEGRVEHIATAGDVVFYTLDSFAGPADLYAIRAGDHRRLTRLNGAKLRSVEVGEAEQFSFAGWDGETVYAYLVKPVGFDRSKTYPIAFLIHGGPQGSFGNDWHYRWNAQVYSGAGYAVVMVDFHGSTGYGQAFTDSIRGDWGGKPLEDLKKGFAAAVERYPFLDATRAVALGASYGGYMIYWMAGNWSQPWKCLVDHDGVFDSRMMAYSTEELWFDEWEHHATQWENPKAYERFNPVNHVAAWKVPMLIVHGALDYRVSEMEGLAMFTALQRMGVPSRLLYFPDENHWVLKPANSILWHDTVLEWIARWTAPNP